MLHFLRRVLALPWVFGVWRWVLTLLGDAQCALRPPAVTAADLDWLAKHARPGDVLLRRFRWTLDTCLIPGKYSHSGIVVGSRDVLHAISEGVEASSLLDFVMHADGFALLRPPYTDDACRDEAIRWAVERCNCPYDFLFDRNTDAAFYCHEYSAKALTAGGVAVAEHDPYLADALIAACHTVGERP